MKFQIKELNLYLHNGAEKIIFSRLNYFYGKMGAGKSSIVRIIDFCLGSSLVLTPALQHEFISSELNIELKGVSLKIDRAYLSDFIRAEWRVNSTKEIYSTILPARKPNGEVIPGTGVEVLSDLIFHLSGLRVPKVRKSKLSDNPELSRLSLRDLLWYCYLDQDNIDSNFFELDSSFFPKRLKSMDVMRFVLGFHQEEVAALEEELKLVHSERVRKEEATKALNDVLKEAKIGSTIEIQEEINRLKSIIHQLEESIIIDKENINDKAPNHISEKIKDDCRIIYNKIAILENSMKGIQTSIDNDTRHLNEILGLSLKFERANSARAILNGVEFKTCPRCTQILPERDKHLCHVCGQEDAISESSVDFNAIKYDVETRVKELRDLINIQSDNLTKQIKEKEELIEERTTKEKELNDVMREYDSAYLSNIIHKQKRIGSLGQQQKNLNRLLTVSRKLEASVYEIDLLKNRESDIRYALNDARIKAESDASNLIKLENYFLDCLIQSGLPGISKSDKVTISTKTFLPVVSASDTDKQAVTTFANIGSGGKKTLFKSCFAIALHRLALEIEVDLPNILIIDSPMKNISERENKDQFEGFYNMIYTLASTEMTSTQFIIIDKELFSPVIKYDFDMSVRHMTPDDNKYPPLIKYYKGH